MIRRFYALIFIPITLALLTQGCGYGFRSRANTWEQQKINKIYIAPMVNDTLRPGVEVPFTSALIREFAQGGRITLVNNEKDADAILESTMQTVETLYLSATTADQVSKDLPLGQGLDSTFLVATEYTATAVLNINLTHKNGQGLWSQGFSRSRIYPAANQGGDIGNTGVLINNSRLTVVLNEIAKSIATEVHDLFFESF